MPGRDFDENGDYDNQCCRSHPEAIGKTTLVFAIKRLGTLKIDHQFKLGRQLHAQVGRLVSLSAIAQRRRNNRMAPFSMSM